MSVTEEKEIEVVAGTIEGVIQKKPDTWQVEVRPDGSQYTKKLWTKDAELVQALSGKLTQAGAFVCSASYWTNQSGTQVRSLWIQNESDGSEPTQSVATPVAARQAQSNNGSEGMTPEKWDAKERRDYRSRAWAQTISALTHTIKVDEPASDVFVRLYALQRKIYRDIVRDFDPEAFEDDDVPF